MRCVEVKIPAGPEPKTPSKDQVQVLSQPYMDPNAPSPMQKHAKLTAMQSTCTKHSGGVLLDDASNVRCEAWSKLEFVWVVHTDLDIVRDSRHSKFSETPRNPMTSNPRCYFPS